MPSNGARPRKHTAHSGQRATDLPETPHGWDRASAGPRALQRKLGCGHTRTFMVAPKKNDVVFCISCDGYRVAL